MNSTDAENKNKSAQNGDSWHYTLEAKKNGRSISRVRQYAGFGLLAVFLMLAIGNSGLLNYSVTPSGNQLLSEMLEAAGSIDAWNAIKEGKYTRTKNIYDIKGDLLSRTKEVFFFRKTDHGTDLMVQTFTDEGEVVLVGKDKDGYWATSNDQEVDARQTAMDLGMMCASSQCTPLCASSMSFYRFSMPFKLTDPGVNAEFAGLTTLDGSETQILDITYNPEVGRDRWVFYADKESHLIHKMEYHHNTDKGNSLPEEFYWSDHRTESGITFSHTWTRYHSNGKVLEEYLYSDVDFKTPLDQNLFERNGDHRLAISSR